VIRIGGSLLWLLRDWFDVLHENEASLMHCTRIEPIAKGMVKNERTKPTTLFNELLASLLGVSCYLFVAVNKELPVGTWVRHCWKHSELSTQETPTGRASSGYFTLLLCLQYERS
jgi:hypothetical protein